MDGMIIGVMKRRIKKYKEIIKTLLEEKSLTDEQLSFLKKEKVVK